MVDYNPNIPQPGDNLSNSQVQMLNNFGQLNTIFDFDHFIFNNATVGNRGLHRQVNLPVVLSANPTPSGTASVVFTKSVAGVAQLYFANSAGVVPLTGTTTSATNGTTFLPGGIILKWGSVTVPSTSQAFTFSGTFPTSCFQVIVSGDGAGNTNRSLYVKTSTVTQSGFTANSFGTYDVIRYIAIGN